MHFPMSVCLTNISYMPHWDSAGDAPREGCNANISKPYLLLTEHPTVYSSCSSGNERQSAPSFQCSNIWLLGPQLPQNICITCKVIEGKITTLLWCVLSWPGLTWWCSAILGRSHSIRHHAWNISEPSVNERSPSSGGTGSCQASLLLLFHVQSSAGVGKIWYHAE